MYNKILVLLDGSKLAECILPHAESLAQNYKSSLVLLSVIEAESIVGRAPPNSDLFQEMMDSKRDELEKYLNGLKGTFRKKKIKAEVHICFGPVVREIVEAADKLSIDLVLIGSHGKSGLLELVFFGGVSSGVLNRINKPLLVVRSVKQ